MNPLCMTTETGFGAIDVARDLGGKLLRRRKSMISTQVLDEFDRHSFAIEVVAVIKQVDFDQTLSGPERRPAADIRDGIVPLPVIPSLGGIDPVRRCHLPRWNPEIGGRPAEHLSLLHS